MLVYRHVPKLGIAIADCSKPIWTCGTEGCPLTDERLTAISQLGLEYLMFKKTSKW